MQYELSHFIENNHSYYAIREVNTVYRNSCSQNLNDVIDFKKNPIRLYYSDLSSYSPIYLPITSNLSELSEFYIRNTYPELFI